MSTIVKFSNPAKKIAFDPQSNIRHAFWYPFRIEATSVNTDTRILDTRERTGHGQEKKWERGSELTGGDQETGRLHSFAPRHTRCCARKRAREAGFEGRRVLRNKGLLLVGLKARVWAHIRL